MELARTISSVNVGGAPVAANLESDSVEFVCLLKNVMSLMTESREQSLSVELDNLCWDVVVLNETWRELESVIWTTSGHVSRIWGHSWKQWGCGFT